MDPTPHLTGSTELLQFVNDTEYDDRAKVDAANEPINDPNFTTDPVDSCFNSSIVLITILTLKQHPTHTCCKGAWSPTFDNKCRSHGAYQTI